MICEFCDRRVRQHVSDEILNKISPYFNDLIVNYRKPPMRRSQIDWLSLASESRMDCEFTDKLKTIIRPALDSIIRWVDSGANGWGKSLESFAQLTQFADFKKDLLEFHTGISPNEYYELGADKRSLQVSQETLETDRRIVDKAIERLNLGASFEGLELSIEGHEQEIEQLLARLQMVKRFRQERAGKLSDVLDQRMILDQQVALCVRPLLNSRKMRNLLVMS